MLPDEPHESAIEFHTGEQPEPGGESPDRTRIEYFRAYQAVLTSPNWIVNLLWGMLAVLSASVIPFVGSLLWTGYLYECVEGWLASRGTRYPDFDPSRFGDYLTRGVWPFLVQLLLWVLVWAIFAGLYVGLIVFAAIAASAGDQYALVIFGAGLPVFVLLLATLLLLAMVCLSPLMLRAGLSQDLAIAFNLKWWRDFLRRVGLEMVLSCLFLAITGMLMTAAGCLIVGIGSYAAWAWVTMANAHLTWQLYELYLSRGGEPIPLKPKKIIPPPYRTPEYGPPGYPPVGFQAPPLSQGPDR